MNPLMLWLLGIKGESLKLTRDQQRIFRRQALIDWLHCPLGVVGFLGIFFVPAGFAAVAIPLLVGNPSVPILHAMLCAAVLGVLYPTAQVFALALGYRWFFRSHIRAALRRIDYELCPRCGHNLGHLSRACPECGWRPELSS